MLTTLFWNLAECNKCTWFSEYFRPCTTLPTVTLILTVVHADIVIYIVLLPVFADQECTQSTRLASERICLFHLPLHCIPIFDCDSAFEGACNSLSI